MTELPKAPVIRLAKEEGIERISKEAEEKFVEAIEDYIREFAESVGDSARHADRKTVQPEDIEFVLKHF